MLPVRPIDRHQVECEARAKMLWGDSREEVVKFLMMQGINATEATALAGELFVERCAIIRAAAVKKIFIGAPLLVLPVAAWIFFTVEFGFVPLKLWSITVMGAIYGLYCLLKGLIMFFSPGSEPGDASDK